MRLNMKNLALLIVVSVLCAGCVATAGDLRELAESTRMQAEEGKDARLSFADELDALADTLDERTEATKQGMLSLQDGGLIGGAATLLAMFGTNMHRDRKRKARGEKTGTEA